MTQRGNEEAIYREALLATGHDNGRQSGGCTVGPDYVRPEADVKQLRIWSSASNYKQGPGNDRQQTQALIESIEFLVLRLASAVHVRQQSLEFPDEKLHKQLGRIYNICIESLQLFSNALDEQRPVPDLPETESLIRDVKSREAELRQSVARGVDQHTSILGFMSAASEIRSLAGVIQDCRDKANALDWEAWNRNYF